jgi:hypothetical protein
MNELQELATRTILGNTLQSWVIALAVFALLLAVLPLLRAALRNRLKKLPPHQSAAPLETALVLLASTTRLFLIAVAGRSVNPRSRGANHLPSRRSKDTSSLLKSNSVSILVLPVNITDRSGLRTPLGNR